MTANTPAPISVERLRELLAEATPGPWRIDAGYDGDVRAESGDIFVAVYRGMNLIEVTGLEATIGPESRGEAVANNALIVAMHEALPTLLHQLAELRNEATRIETENREGWKQAAHWRERAEAAERAREEAERDLRAIYEAVPGLPIYATEEDADRATDAFTAICHLCNDYIVSAASGGPNG